MEPKLRCKKCNDEFDSIEEAGKHAVEEKHYDFLDIKTRYSVGFI